MYSLKLRRCIIFFYHRCKILLLLFFQSEFLHQLKSLFDSICIECLGHIYQIIAFIYYSAVMEMFFLSGTTNQSRGNNGIK
jgi:hypothetical protein